MDSPCSTGMLDDFLRRAAKAGAGDARVEAVLVGGSVCTAESDRFSDLDLVVVCREDAYDEIMRGRREFAAGLGRLLAAFTGEHVGEPRLLICLYDEPLLHVDLKFIRQDDLARRVETPLVVFDREGNMPTLLEGGTVRWPSREPEWFEERFWVWMHYGACRIARGELFEAHDLLAFVRSQVLGPMIARGAGRRQRGVRRLEAESPASVGPLARCIPSYGRDDCWRALRETVRLYKELRVGHPSGNINPDAEVAVMRFVEENCLAATVENQEHSVR